MIEKLNYFPNTDIYGNTYGVIPPSTKMIVDKINEIIGYLNNNQNGSKNNIQE